MPSLAAQVQQPPHEVYQELRQAPDADGIFDVELENMDRWPLGLNSSPSLSAQL